MKIMTYNILEGGVDENGSRISDIIEVIKTENPDFLAIQEANHFEKNDYELLKRIGKEANLPHYAFSEGTLYEKNKRYHIVCLSRFPIEETHTFPNDVFQVGALSVVIDSPLGKLSIACVHLHVGSEDERFREAKLIIDYQSKYKQSIILGDHNALSSLDNYNDLSTEEFTSYDLVNFKTTDLFTDKGYIDVMADRKITNASTHPTIGVGHPICKTPIRIDYMWLVPTLAPYIQSASVIKTSTAEIASDHYPLTMTIERTG